MFGLASEAMPLDYKWSHENQILIHLHDVSYRGGAADRSGVPDAGAANKSDMIKAVYEADDDTLAFFRNSTSWGRTLQLSQKGIASSEVLRLSFIRHRPQLFFDSRDNHFITDLVNPSIFD